MKKNKGFTLIEIVITVLVIGVLSIAITPVYNALSTSASQTYREQQRLINQKIAKGLVDFASESTTLGTLPAPYTGSGYTSTVYNSTDVTTPGLNLTAALTQTGVNLLEINEDNYNSHRVRMYQRVTGLSFSTPLMLRSGPSVTLTYQFGAVYETACPKATAACNPGSGIAGASSTLTSGNYTTWATTSTDLPATYVSTLPLQKQMMATTASRLNKMRKSMQSYFSRMAAANTDQPDTNWFPPDSGSSDPPEEGADPDTNQGCLDGWYDLVTYPDILATVGLDSAEFGDTMWGGHVEFCRDYDPNELKYPDIKPPYYGAFRINKTLSTGSNPDSSSGGAGNNVFLSF